LDQINWTISKFRQEIDCRHGFFESDNSNEAKFESKSSSNNRNVKNIMFGFKIRMKGFYMYSIFFGSDKFEYSDQATFCQHYLS